jgi:hypothetical protein
MTALDTDKRATGLRKQGPEMIADDAIGTANDFRNGSLHSMSSPCIWHMLLIHVPKVPWGITRNLVHSD